MFSCVDGASELFLRTGGYVSRVVYSVDGLPGCSESRRYKRGREGGGMCRVVLLARSWARYSTLPCGMAVRLGGPTHAQ